LSIIISGFVVITSGVNGHHINHYSIKVKGQQQLSSPSTTIPISFTTITIPGQASPVIPSSSPTNLPLTLITSNIIILVHHCSFGRHYLSLPLAANYAININGSFHACYSAIGHHNQFFHCQAAVMSSPTKAASSANTFRH